MTVCLARHRVRATEAGWSLDLSFFRILKCNKMPPPGPPVISGPECSIERFERLRRRRGSLRLNHVCVGGLVQGFLRVLAGEHSAQHLSVAIRRSICLLLHRCCNARIPYPLRLFLDLSSKRRERTCERVITVV